jgi:hypothetical protein
VDERPLCANSGCPDKDADDPLAVVRGLKSTGQAQVVQTFGYPVEKVPRKGDGAAQLYVPTMFTIGAAGQPAQPTRFLMNLILVKTPGGWKVSSILPIPAPTQ